VIEKAAPAQRSSAPAIAITQPWRDAILMRSPGANAQARQFIGVHKGGVIGLSSYALGQMRPPEFITLWPAAAAKGILSFRIASRGVAQQLPQDHPSCAHCPHQGVYHTGFWAGRPDRHHEIHGRADIF